MPLEAVFGECCEAADELKALAVFGIAASSLLAGLAAGGSIGAALTKRSAVTTDLVVLSFSGNRSALAFEEMKPAEAWDVLNEHRLLITTKGAALNEGLRHMELMLVDARLGLLAKELNKHDGTWRAEAALECGRAGIKDCSQGRLELLARRRAR